MSLVDQTLIDLDANAAFWRVPGFQVDSLVHEVRALDRHLFAPAAKSFQRIGGACLPSKNQNKIGFSPER
jgi:hypothetical protein